MTWLTKLFTRKPKFKRVELRFVPYQIGDMLIKKNVGWRLAKEEDRNKLIGWVFLERVEKIL